MAKKKNQFSKEFKAEIVRLVIDGGRKCSEVAGEHEVPVSSVYAWVQQARVDAGNGLSKKATSNEREELTRLRQINKNLEMENAFLKKTSAYFASLKK